MAVRKVRVVPDAVLRKKAKKVTEIDASVKRLITDMIDTMHEPQGVRRAAPQVGVSLRVVVIEVPDHDTIVLINPEIIKKEGERVVNEA
jgi:peptide deformylase